MSGLSIIVGALVGLVVTVLPVYLAPKGTNRHLVATIGALVGVGVAYLIMTQVKL